LCSTLWCDRPMCCSSLSHAMSALQEELARRNALLERLAAMQQQQQRQAAKAAAAEPEDGLNSKRWWHDEHMKVRDSMRDSMQEYMGCKYATNFQSEGRKQSSYLCRWQQESRRRRWLGSIHPVSAAQPRACP